VGLLTVLQAITGAVTHHLAYQALDLLGPSALAIVLLTVGFCGFNLKFV
jgi:hypothetical protein